MGAAIGKCIGGGTDYNNNGVPDNKDIQNLIETYVAEQKQKKKKKVLKKILSGKLQNNVLATQIDVRAKQNIVLAKKAYRLKGFATQNNLVATRNIALVRSHRRQNSVLAT